MTSELKTRIYAQAVGRRKRSVAKVRFVAGEGQIKINGKSPEKYFGKHQDLERIKKSFLLLGLEKYDASVLVSGGGMNGQLDAVVLGVARAAASLKKDNKKALREAGLLTRDSRKRQRRMVGTGGKSRRKKQSPKR